MTKRINLISGPRNISTALMYSFANRTDTKVVDEPMYAYYLQHTGITYHPGTQEILENLPSDIEEVKRTLIFQSLDVPIYFIKGMAHHYKDVALDFILDLQNVFLIRDPYQLITSFSKVIKRPSMRDIGLQLEWEICDYILTNGATPIVLDSNDILDSPKQTLTKLCQKLEIPFEVSMLSWESGPIAEDGVWAKHWYKNVWKSTGFKKQSSSSDTLPDMHMELYKESIEYYKRLSEHKI